jgi:hypothetical protein
MALARCGVVFEWVRLRGCDALKSLRGRHLLRVEEPLPEHRRGAAQSVWQPI